MITRIVVQDRELAEQYAAKLALKGIGCTVWPTRTDGTTPLSAPRDAETLRQILGTRFPLLED